MVSRIMKYEELPEILTVEEVRCLLGVSRSKAYEIVRQESFPKVNVGRCFRIPKKSLVSWLTSQTGSKE